MNTYTYEIVSTEEGELARCIEIGVEALGPTRDAAVTELRRALAAKLNGVEGVAPPDTKPIEFELVPRAKPKLEPFGPGDVPRASFTSHPTFR